MVGPSDVPVIDLDVVTERKRNALGRYEPGHLENVTGGTRAVKLLDHPAIAAVHQEHVRAIVSDLGGEAALSWVQRGLVRQLAAVTLMADSHREKLFREGITNSKGKVRSAYKIYLDLVDRQAKLSAQVGLARVPAKVPDIQDYITLKGQA